MQKQLGNLLQAIKVFRSNLRNATFTKCIVKYIYQHIIFNNNNNNNNNDNNNNNNINNNSNNNI